MALEKKGDINFDESSVGTPGIQPAVRPEDPVSVEERRLVRKLDRRILPITCLMYLFACQHCIGLFYTGLFDSLHCDDVRLGQN